MKKGLAKTNGLFLLGGLCIVALFAYLGFSSKPAGATANNQTINFQGRLLNSQGAVAPDGFYNIEFKVYQDGDGQSANDSTGSPSGSLKWTEDWLNSGGHGVKVVNGFMSVQLGSVTAFGSNINWNQGTLWLSMQVGDTSSCTITTNFHSNCSGDGEMLPMQPLTASPYSLNSGELNGLTSTNFVQLAQGVQTDSSTASSIFINKTGSSGSVLELQKGGVDIMNVSNTGTTLFQPTADSTTALQVENHANSYSVFTVDTTNNQVILGKTSNLTGKLAFATAGGGTLTINPTSSASNFTITFPAETGTVCTTAASGTCNTAGGLSNVAYLNQDQTLTGKNTFSRSGSGSSDYSLGVTGTPAASSTSSLIRIGNALTGGNGAANGGTYISIVEPGSGAGSAADFFNLQNGNAIALQLTTAGNLTIGGTYNGNTFDNSGHLTFGNSGAAVISSNGANNITLDTGSSGGTETLGNSAATTNIGTSNAAHTIGIGTGGGGTNTEAITIGAATNSSSTLTLQGGNGTGSISLLTGNNGGVAGSIQIGNTSGAFNQTISIGTNNAASNIVNLGTGTSQDSVTIGDNTNANSSVSLKAGSTGGINLGANTSLSANSNLTYVSGTGGFDAHNASGAFQTSTGNNSLNGATTVTGTNTFTVNGGATTLNGAAAGSGVAAKVNTNAASNVGVVIQGVSSQTAALLQLQDSTSTSVLTSDVAGDLEQLGYHNTPYGGVGTYGNLLVQSEQLGTTWSASNITVTQNDGASNPAPDGNTTADKLVSTASGTHTLTQTYSSAGNNTYTFSIWLKSATPPQPVSLRIDSNGTPATGTVASFNVTGNWQRYSVTQTFTSGVTTVTPTLVMTNNNASIVGWGAQLVQGSSAGVYVRTSSNTVAAGSGLIDNQSAIFQALTNSATAYQFQNAAGSNVAAIDTSSGQLVLGSGGASGVTGQIQLNYSGQTGSITLQTANPSSTAYNITIPAENGTVCTTAASAACTAVYAPAGGGYVNFAPSSVQADSSNNSSIFINKTSGTGNILELQKSASDVFKIDNSGNVTSTGQNTLSRNSSGSNDYTLGVTGTPSATGSSSLIRIGGALTGGNGVANGGTYLSIVEPSSSAGSAADFLNLQNGSTVELQLASNGNLTVGGTYNGNTFDNAGHLTFGNSGAAVISSNGSNNITIDTGSSGGTEALGNNAATTNIGTSNAAHTIGIGTGGGGTNTEAVTIGAATNSSSTLTLQGGNTSSAILLQTGNNGAVAGGIQIGNTAGAFSQTISIGNNSAAANTVNIGTGTAQDSVVIGDNTNASSSVNLKAGSTGGISLGANTTLSANSNLTYAAGSGGFDAHNASGAFQTSTGNNSLNGATTVTGTNTFTVNGGATTLKGAAGGSGTAVTVNSNAASNVGLVVQGVSSQAAALLQLQDSTGTSVLNGDASGDMDLLGYQNTPYGGTGAYGNLIVQSEQLGTTWSASNITVTQNDGASNPAPDGNTTADKLVSTASGTHTLTQTYSSAGNNTYTFSIWLKSATPPQPVSLRIDSNGTPATGTAASLNVTGNWQRYSVTETFTSGVTTITPTLVITNNNASIVGWGAQLIQASTPGVYVRTSAGIVAAGSGLIDNQSAIFQALTNSATAYQFQNASGANVAAVDTTNGQVILGSGTGSITGQIKFNFTGQTGSITLAPLTPSSTNYTINLPAENGTICTTAASAACTAVYAPAGGGYVNFAPASVQSDASNNNSIFINKTSGTGNILELQKSAADVFKIDNTGNVTSTGQNTLSRNSSGSNDYTLGITGTPSATGSSSLIRIGNALSGGNGAANGGTYLSIVEPAAAGATAGSAADFLNLQNGSTVELQLTSTGNLTVGGTYNGNTFDNAGHLTFGNSGAAVISSNGSNNITIDTGSSGGTEALGNNAATTNIGTSNAAHTIGIGTGGGGTTTQAITIGAATNSSSTLTLQGGNGTGSISLLTGNNGTVAGSIQIGNTSGAFTQTISIATNNAAANTVNLGTGTSQDSVTIGDSTNANSSVSLKAGSTGGISLGANTTLSANSNLTYTAGSGSFDAHNATGTFDSTSGTNQLNGNTTVTGTKTFTVNGGLTTLKAGLSVQSGAAGTVGAIVQGASSQTASLLQIQDSTGAVMQNFDSSGDLDLAGGYINTAYGGFGQYSNLLKDSEQFDQGAGAPWTYSNVTTPTANNATPKAPDGNATAEGLASTASGTHTVTQSVSSGAGTYTFSVWLSALVAQSPQSVQLRIDSTGGTPTTGTASTFTTTTSWQRLSVTQTFTGSPTAIIPTIVISANNVTINAWGAQLVSGSTPQTYVRSLGSAVSAGDGLVDNGTAVFQNSANSTTAYQFQNASGTSLLTVNTSNNALIVNSGVVYVSNTFSSGVTATITQATIDNNTTVLASATAGSLTFTVPSPTVTTGGRLLYVSNNGANPFTLSYGTGGFTLNTNSTASLIWNGSNWTSAGVDASALQNAYANSTGGATPEIKIDGTRGALDIQDADGGTTNNLLNLRAANGSGLGALLFGVGSTGAIQIQNSVNSTTAFQIQNATGSQEVNVNTTTTNLVTNPSIEQTISGNWTTKGTGATVTQTNSQQYIGNDALSIVTAGSANAGAQESLTLLANTTYTLSLYAKSFSSSVATINVGRQDQSGTDVDCLTAQTITSTAWTQLSCSFTTGASISSPNIYIKDTGTSHTFYIDAVQLSRFSLLSDPSMEQAIAGNWAAYNGAGGTIAQTATQHEDGSNSLSMANGGVANRGMQQSITLNNSTEYYLSFYAMTTVNFSSLRVGYSSTGATGGEVDCLSSQSVVTTGWTQYSCNFTTPSSNSGTPYLYFVDTSSTSLTFYIDAVELTLGPPVAYYSAGAPAAGSFVTNPTTAYQEGSVALNGIINSPVIIQGQSNSTSAFQVQSANGAALFVADTTNRQIRIYENNGSTNYALLYYDSATSTANYTANSGTVAVGAGASGISIVSGSGSSITIQADASSTWRTTTGTITLQGTSGLNLNGGSGSTAVSISGSNQFIVGQPTTDGTCNAGAIIYNTTSHTLRGCQGSTPAWNDLINVTTPTLQQTYTASTGGTTPEVVLDTTRGALDIQGNSGNTITDLFNVHAGTATGLGQSLLDVSNTGVLTSTTSTGIITLQTSSTAVSIGQGSTPHTTNPIILVLDNYQPVTAGSEPTEQDGAMYYDADDNIFRCGVNGLWTTCTVNNIQDTYAIEEEFVGGGTTSGQIGALNWNTSAITGGASTLAYNTTMTPTADRPGTFGITTPATLNDGASVWLGGGGTSGTAIVNNTEDFKASIAVGATISSMDYRVGLLSETTATTTTNNGIWVEYNSGTAQWQWCYGTGAAVTCQAATTANGFVSTHTVTASTWVSVEIKVLSATSAEVCFDQDCVAKTLTGLGTGAVNPTLACYALSGAARSCFIDYYQISATTSAAR